MLKVTVDVHDLENVTVEVNSDSMEDTLFECLYAVESIFASLCRTDPAAAAVFVSECMNGNVFEDVLDDFEGLIARSEHRDLSDTQGKQDEPDGSYGNIIPMFKGILYSEDDDDED